MATAALVIGYGYCLLILAVMLAGLTLLFMAWITDVHRDWKAFSRAFDEAEARRRAVAVTGRAPEPRHAAVVSLQEWQ